MVGDGREKDDTLFRWADQLPDPLWQDVRSRDGQEAAQCVGATLTQSVFQVPMLGRIYQVDPVAQRITISGDPDYRVGFQSGVVLLYALARSMGVPPSGRMVSPMELTGGKLFFQGAHTLATRPLAQCFAADPTTLADRANAMGAEAIGGADFAVRIPGLPLLPLYVLCWRGDGEDDGRAFIGIDDRALFHLDLGAVFALTNVLVGRLTH